MSAVRAAFVAVLLAAAAAVLPARAADAVRVRAMVDRSEIGEGEDVRLIVEIAGPGLDHVGPPDVHDLGDFALSGGPSVSSRFQWVNGVSTSSKTYTYALTPNKTGKLTIPSLAILAQGQTYRTNPVEVMVQPQGTVRSPYQPSSPSSPSSPGGPAGSASGPGGRPRPGAAPVALKVRSELDRKEVYVGQQVTLKVVLDTQSEILSHGPAESPSFPGFWAEEITLPERTELRRISIDGEPWYEITLMKRALFPTTAGTLTIPPIAWQVQVRRRSADPFESFFFTPTEMVTRRSDPLPLKVQALPAAGRPEGFSGAVGNFSLSATADRTESRVNDAVGLKIRVAGEGNLGAAAAPGLGDLVDFKTFDPKITSNTSLQVDKLRSEKIWDYVVIPLAPGSQAIPPISFSYFDPEAKAYRTVTSKPLPIQVARGEAVAGGPAVAGLPQSDIRLLRRDIHYLHAAPEGLEGRRVPFHQTPWFVALCLAPMLADVGVLAWARTRDLSPQASRSRRERRARGAARRRLAHARRLLKPQSAQPFYASVAQALTGYVGDKFHTAGTGLTHERIEALLAERGVPDDRRAAFHRCLEACDFARFAPASSDDAAMRTTLADAEETIAGIERSLER
ncbi:MAG TPA: BatD family protein [Candidatus Polarisedimenticolia bacterium]|nr:BatD family protein [Candidatus Polarisedimenticolia bacterium]